MGGWRYAVAMTAVPKLDQPLTDDSATEERIGGAVLMSPRPAPAHVHVASQIHGFIHRAYSGGDDDSGPGGGSGDGPGGWWIYHEPELRLGEDKLVPDIAGWRRASMPVLPDEAFFRQAPAWVCEVLSESTEAWDRVKKMPVYAAHQVQHVWLVDPLLRTLEVFQLEGSRYLLLNAYLGDGVVEAEPFTALRLNLGRVWPPRGAR